MDFDFDSEERSSGQARHQPRKIRRSDDLPSTDPVTVDSTDFFRPGQENPAGPAPVPSPAEPTADSVPVRGLLMVVLVLQAVLSAAALFQLYRTGMLPLYYLVILAALLVLLWLLVYKCQRYKVRGFLTRVFSVLLSAGMAVGCVWAQQGLEALDKVTIGDETVTDFEAMAITQEPFVVYLSGVDTRGELTENARSDVNILAVVNPVTKRVALVNTPRDYYVDLAGTDSKDKLTHAGLYGVETSMETLGNLYGIEVDHYVRINFAGFMDIVDALGGVDVYSDYTFTSVGSPGYYDPTDFVEGWNHLDGPAALAFARERHAFATGDIQRGINQMKVINAMLEKIKSPALLTSYSRLLVCRMEHRGLQRHRFQLLQHPLLFGSGAKALCDEAGRGLRGRGSGADPVGAQRRACPGGNLRRQRRRFGQRLGGSGLNRIWFFQAEPSGSALLLCFLLILAPLSCCIL